MERPVVDFPQPELADQRQGLARQQAERDALDRVHPGRWPAKDAGPDRKARDQILDLEDRPLAFPDRRGFLLRRGRRIDGAQLTLGAPQVDVRKFQWPAPAGHAAELGHGGQELAGVGVLGGAEEPPDRPLLDLLAAPHDDHPVGDLGHHPHVVGDEHHRHPDLLLELLDEAQDLGLYGDVERRRRLVGDQQLRLAGERHGDHDALAHAAREHVRVVLQPLLRVGDAHPPKQLDRRPLGLGRRHGAVVAERLGDLEADGEHRVEAGHRLLEDHRDRVAANCAHPLFGERQEVPALEFDAALDPAVRHGHETHDGERGDALAGARIRRPPPPSRAGRSRRRRPHHSGPRALDAERGGQPSIDSGASAGRRAAIALTARPGAWDRWRRAARHPGG